MERKKCSPFSPSNLTPRVSSSALRTASSAGSSADLGQEAGLAGVGGQEPGQILRGRQRGSGEQHPLEELQEAPALLLLGAAGMGGQGPELGLGRREPVAFQLTGAAVLVDTQQQELAQVGHQHLAVGFQVAQHLGRPGDGLDVGAGRLHLDGAAGRLLAAESAQLGVAGERRRRLLPARARAPGRR